MIFKKFTIIFLASLLHGNCAIAMNPHINDVEEIKFDSFGYRLPVHSLALLSHPDGKTYLVSAADAPDAPYGEIRIWDIEKRKPIRSFIGHTGTIYSVKIMGPFIISGSWDGTINLWSLASLGSTAWATFPCGDSHIINIQCLENNRIAAITNSDEVFIWNIESQTLENTFGSGKLYSPYSAYLGDGILAIYCSSNMVTIWNVETGTCLKTLSIQDPDGDKIHLIDSLIGIGNSKQFLIAASYNSLPTKYHVWDWEQGMCLYSCSDWYPSAINSVESMIKLSETTILASTANMTFSVYDHRDNKIIWQGKTEALMCPSNLIYVNNRIICNQGRDTNIEISQEIVLPD